MDRLLVLAAIVLILVAVFWFVRGRGIKTLGRISHQHRRSKEDEPLAGLSTKARQLAKLRHSKQFWGVEIQQAGCAAAHALDGRQFAFEDAPELPLAGCDAPRCPCQYKGLKEHRSYHRRTQEDRRKEMRYDPAKPDRRSLKDRRRRFDQWKGRA